MAWLWIINRCVSAEGKCMASCVINTVHGGSLYEQMRCRIIEGRHRPGAFLSESALARFYGTSRTPVREALSRLWEAGYVDRLPGHGYLISRITAAQVRDTLEIRRLLETEATVRVAESNNPEGIEHIQSSASAESEPGSRLSSTRNNGAFHLAIVNATKNMLWIDMMSRCLFHVDRFFALLPDPKRFREASVAEHATILEAIKRRDPQGARAAMDHHLSRTSRVLLKALERGDLSGVTA